MLKIKSMLLFIMGVIIVGYMDFSLVYLAFNSKPGFTQFIFSLLCNLISGLNCITIPKMKLFKSDNANRWMPVIGFLLAVILYFLFKYNYFDSIINHL